MPALTTEQAKAAFKTSTTKLLKKLKENSDPVIVVRSCFWPDQAKDTILKQACGEVGGIFVDAGARGKDEAYFARSERQFSHAGVAAHPGDTRHEGHRRRHTGSTEQGRHVIRRRARRKRLAGKWGQENVPKRVPFFCPHFSASFPMT